MKARRVKWLSEHGPCVDCGSADDLEIDHVDRTAKIEHRVWSWCKERRHEELAKCVVRCFKCHVIKTVAERGHILISEPGAAHGLSGYAAGCRCEICYEAKSSSNKRYKKTWRAKRKLLLLAPAL